MFLYKLNPLKTLLQHVEAKFFLFPVAVILTISFASCDKSSVIGLDVQPANDLLNVKFDDTAKLYTKTVREDHLRTDQGLITSGTALIGKYIDPLFGETQASMYSQLRQPNNLGATSFGTNPVCDSIVLSLVYGGAYYGEAVGRRPLRTQKINVYEVMNDISHSIPYYSDTLGVPYSTHDLVKSNHSFVPDISGCCRQP